MSCESEQGRYQELTGASDPGPVFSQSPALIV